MLKPYIRLVEASPATEFALPTLQKKVRVSSNPERSGQVWKSPSFEDLYTETEEMEWSDGKRSVVQLDQVLAISGFMEQEGHRILRTIDQ